MRLPDDDGEAIRGRRQSGPVIDWRCLKVRTRHFATGILPQRAGNAIVLDWRALSTNKWERFLDEQERKNRLEAV